MSPLLALLLIALLQPEIASAQIVEFYHVDAVGNVLAVTDSAGAVVEQHDYLPFGEEWCPSPPPGVCGSATPGQPKRFTGKERDQETGLDYFGARYYGSKIGRFTTTDPFLDQQAALVDPQRWNRYAYGRNNPLRYVDPDGRNPIIVQRAIELGQKVWNSPAGQQARTWVGTQSANLWIWATRAATSPAAQEAVQAGAELASGADIPGGIPGNLPFKSGDVIRRQFETSKGVVEMMAEAVIEGKKLHLRDIAVYPHGAEKLDVGMREMLQARGALAEQARELGFQELRITGTRRTGANPGKVVDVTIPLVKKEQ